MAHPTHSIEVRTLGPAPRTTIRAGARELLSDAPPEQGGGGEGLSPSELLLAAIAACKSMTIQMYAARKGYALDRVTVRATDEPDPGAPAQAAGSGRSVIRCEVSLEGGLDEAQRARLLEITGRCPVSRLVGAGAEIRDTLRV